MLPTKTEQYVDVIRERNTVKEAQAILRISHASFYDRVKRGQLRLTKDGKRSFVTRQELQRYLSAGESSH